MPESESEKKKRVAKNTLMLYIRMFLTMAISLYTSRIVLEQLGIHDYGVYNVVGGIVSMFSIVSASMTSAISRFLTYELGTGNKEKLKLIFSNAVTIQLLMGIGIAILIETIGVWFLNEKMNIAPERMVAANWVLQFSTVTFIVNMISVPYNASIISHEKMSAFAYISVLEVILKLGVAYMLFIRYFDSLIWYAFLIMVVSIVIRIIYSIYCNRFFEECHSGLHLNKDIFKPMFAFSGWNFIGSSSGILKDQGVNIVLNIFYGSSINAARGIANQVNAAISGFAGNFMLALNPQIIKSYAQGETKYMNNLIVQGARISFYLLMFISLPIIIEAPMIMSLWLVKIPEYAVDFTRLVLIVSIIESLNIPLQYANQASGKIRTYQLIVGGLQIMNLPVSYICLILGCAPYSVYYVSLMIAFMGLLARLIILKKTIKLDVKYFCSKVVVNCLIVTVITCSLPLVLYLTLHNNWYSVILIFLSSWIWSIMSFYFIGCDAEEKEKVKNLMYKFILKFIKHA